MNNLSGCRKSLLLQECRRLSEVDRLKLRKLQSPLTPHNLSSLTGPLASPIASFLPFWHPHAQEKGVLQTLSPVDVYLHLLLLLGLLLCNRCITNRRGRGSQRIPQNAAHALCPLGRLGWRGVVLIVAVDVQVWGNAMAEPGMMVDLAHSDALAGICHEDACQQVSALVADGLVRRELILDCSMSWTSLSKWSGLDKGMRGWVWWGSSYAGQRHAGTAGVGTYTN